MKALLINYNRMTLPIQMANFLFNHNIDPIIVDNNSDYQPLLEYYQTRCPYQVVRMDKNYGEWVIWQQNLIERLGITGNYIVSDPDLDLSAIPDDFLSVLEAGLKKYPQFDKCGFSLEIDDPRIPQCTKDWETKFWQHPLDEMYFHAPIDTTFALYKSPVFSLNAIRTNRPYVAKHMPWYYSDIKELPQDEQYYFNSQNESTKSHSHLKR